VNVTDTRDGAPDGSDTLLSVETLQFADGSSTFLVTDGMSIQAAVDAASEGDTINLADGATFREQVVINGIDNLTIAGNGATIEMADSPVVTGNGNEAVITVLNATGVMIDDVTVDGRGLGSSNGFNGIYFGDAGGTVQNATVTGIRAPLQDDGSPQGTQIGRAIHADNNDGAARTITLTATPSPISRRAASICAARV